MWISWTSRYVVQPVAVCLYFLASFLRRYVIRLYSILLSVSKSFMLTLRTFAILFNVWRSGCDALEHHRLVVVVLTPSCSASHLPVFFCSTSTTFNRFKSSIVILFKFNAKVLTILGRTVIKAFFLCFYNEFAERHKTSFASFCSAFKVGLCLHRIADGRNHSHRQMIWQ